MESVALTLASAIEEAIGAPVRDLRMRPQYNGRAMLATFAVDAAVAAHAVADAGFPARLEGALAMRGLRAMRVSAVALPASRVAQAQTEGGIRREDLRQLLAVVASISAVGAAAALLVATAAPRDAARRRRKHHRSI